MKNQDLVEAFANGATEGHTGSIHVYGDTLYSYAMPIARRLADGTFIVSNEKVALGGRMVSRTTSIHIGLAHYHCRPNVTQRQVVDS